MTATIHAIQPATAPIDLLWPAYPKRLTERGAWVRNGKADAKDELDKLLRAGESLDHIVSAARQYGKLEDPRYVPDLFRWLKKRRFMDYEPEQEAEIIPISGDEQRWQDIKAEMKTKMPDKEHRTWIAPLELAGTGATATLIAPTEYHSQWVIREYLSRLRHYWGRPVTVTHRRGG